MDKVLLAGFVGVIIGVVAVTALLFSVNEYTRFYQDGYEKGQIDALIGNIKYELVTQPDSTRVWKEITNETQ